MELHIPTSEEMEANRNKKQELVEDTTDLGVTHVKFDPTIDTCGNIIGLSELIEYREIDGKNYHPFSREVS